MALEVSIELPDWAEKFMVPAQYKCIYGGRSSGKTFTVATLLILKCMTQYALIACCREFGSSISFSAKPALESAIHRLDQNRSFDIKKYYIRNKKTNAMIFFHGMERSKEAIKGWDNVTDVWYEEAQQMSHDTARILIPTLFRGAEDKIRELWVTWNPGQRTDWAWRRFITNPRDNDVIEMVNWDHIDNKWFPFQSNQERLYDKVNEPEWYEHIWNGEPADSLTERRILPYRLVEAALEGYRKELHKGCYDFNEVGLDVADEAGNNALAMRNGPVLEHAEKWSAKRLGITSRRANTYAIDNNVRHLVYDSQGVGSGIKSYLDEIPNRSYSVRPEVFHGEIKGPDNEFSFQRTNKQFFDGRNTQMGWSLRLRAQRTERLLKGDTTVNPKYCFFINPKIPHLNELVSQLSQPSYQETNSGKVKVDKYAETHNSPDLYDATILAFSRDSSRGIKKIEKYG